MDQFSRQGMTFTCKMHASDCLTEQQVMHFLKVLFDNVSSKKTKQM